MSPGSGPPSSTAARAWLIRRSCALLLFFGLVLISSVRGGCTPSHTVMSPMRRQLVRSCRSAKAPSSLQALSKCSSSAVRPALPYIGPGDWLRHRARMNGRWKPKTCQASASPTERSWRASRSHTSCSKRHVAMSERSRPDWGSGAFGGGCLPLRIRVAARFNSQRSFSTSSRRVSRARWNSTPASTVSQSRRSWMSWTRTGCIA